MKVEETPCGTAQPTAQRCILLKENHEPSSNLTKVPFILYQEYVLVAEKKIQVDVSLRRGNDFSLTTRP